jgi:deoxyribodipyrimidine photo-lyase
MVVASFLCKHLMIQWQGRRSLFCTKLLDYELSSNVGIGNGHGTGCDAALILGYLILKFS